MFAVGIFVYPPTPPGSEHSIHELPKQHPPLTVYCTEDVGKKIDSTVGIFVYPPTPPGSEHSIHELPKQHPPFTVYCTEDVGKKIDSTVSVRKPKDADSAPQLNKPPDSTYYTASTSSSRSVNSVPTSSPRFVFKSARPSSQHSLKTGSANDSPASIIRRNFADHVSGRSSAIPQDSQSLKSLTASALEEFELFAEDDNLAPDSATSGLTPERPFDETLRKRLQRGPVSAPSIIVMEKTKHLVTPIPVSPKKSTLLGQESYANESRNVAVDLAMPTGSCLFSRTFDEELDELPSIPPVRLATTPTAFMFAETSSSVRDFVGYHYPGDYLPRMFWNYNLGKLIALTRFDSTTGESGTVLYSDSDNGKFGKTGRKEWEHRGRIVSTVWEATPKLRGRGKDALQTIYIKTLAKTDPRQLYNPIFLHALRRRYPLFPEIIGEWETQNLHVVVVRNCGLALERKGLYDRIIGRKFSQVDWPSFIR